VAIAGSSSSAQLNIAAVAKAALWSRPLKHWPCLSSVIYLCGVHLR
jgi:hypothetical protein